MLVYSGNDAAVCVAEGVAGSVPAFVDLMNAKAAELGMWGTSYANPHGLDADGHYSTPVDLVTLARYAMQIPAFASIVGSSGVTVVLGGEEATFASTDELLNAYPGMRGIKTGYTDAAGRTFVGAATRGGQTVYVCVLGCSSNEERWADVAALLDWAFAHADQTTLDVGAQALGGSLCYVDRFGWSVAASTDLAASLRADPATGEAADAQAELTWLATTGFADANDQVAQVAWYDGDGLVAARSATTGAPFSSGAYFGPLVSALFGDVS
jgi:D-alanyl-D-alanine carboxypeptidase (penicillin-binding protein 5/6)